MERESVRVLVYAGLLILAYYAWRNGLMGSAPAAGTRRIDSVSGQILTSETANELTHLRATGQAGGSI